MKKPPSTLSGTEQGIFTCMSLLDQILSAEFFSKISKFWRPVQLIKFYNSCQLVALKTSIFLAFQTHARQG